MNKLTFTLFSFIVFSLSIISCGTDCTITTWYQDADEDGRGNLEVTQEACEMPAGYVNNSTDLNDNDDFFNYNIEINNPTLDEYKIGDNLPLEIRFYSEEGERVFNFSYEVRNVATGFVLFSDQGLLSETTSTYTVNNDIITLTDSDDVQANSDWIIEAKVWGLIGLDELVSKTKEFKIVE